MANGRGVSRCSCLTSRSVSRLSVGIKSGGWKESGSVDVHDLFTGLHLSASCGRRSLCPKVRTETMSVWHYDRQGFSTHFVFSSRSTWGSNESRKIHRPDLNPLLPLFSVPCPEVFDSWYWYLLETCHRTRLVTFSRTRFVSNRNDSPTSVTFQVSLGEPWSFRTVRIHVVPTDPKSNDWCRDREHLHWVKESQAVGGNRGDPELVLRGRGVGQESHVSSF